MNINPFRKKMYANQATDWFIARSLGHAKRLANRHYRDYNGYCEREDIDVIQRVPDHIELSYFPDPYNDDEPIKKTAGEFAAEYPVGFFMTENY